MGLAPADPFNIEVLQLARILAPLLCFSPPGLTPEQAERSVSDFLDFPTPVFELDFDSPRLAGTQLPQHGAIQHTRRRRKGNFVARSKVESFTLIHNLDYASF
jgi:hypothetical protein